MAINGYLYPGEGNPSSGKLRDPTVLAPSGAVITVNSTATLLLNDNNPPWLTEATGQEWLTEITGQPWLVEEGYALAVFLQPEVHSGTVVVTGAGIVTVVGQEGAQRQIVVTGAGVVTATARKDVSGSVVVTGAGTVAIAQTTARARALSITGAGTVVVSGSEGAARAVVVTGAGVVSETHSTQRSGSVSVHGAGGVLVTGEQTVLGIVVTGGGTVSVTGVRTGGESPIVVVGRLVGPWARPRYVERHEGIVRVSGGGEVYAWGEKGALAEIELTGGGGLDVYGYKRYPAQYQALLITALAA